MTNAEFKAIRKQMNMTQPQLAAALGFSATGVRTVQRIEAGGVVTGPVALAMRHLLATHPNKEGGS